MITLDKLVFDPSSPGDGASLGAYLRASDGTLLTHTDVSGKKALDVRVAEGINVEVDLSHVDDSVKIGDGTDFLEVNADGSINVAQASATAASFGEESVTNSATKIIATNLANRRSVIVQNLGNKDMFFGHDNTVTPATGIRLAAGSSIELPFGDSLDVYGITASGTADARYLEVA